MASKRDLIQKLLKDIETGDSSAAAVVNEAKYIQHNPQIADCVAALRTTLETTVNGEFLRYDQVHRVLAEGNFALCTSEGRRDEVHSSFYDLFRVTGGKIVEHWDTIEAIAPRSKWKNENGKF